MDLSNFREEYLKGQLHRKDLAENPFEQFQTWFEQALKADIPEPNAFSLATADAQGRPSLRTVLLKYFDQTGFVFFTNYGSFRPKLHHFRKKTVGNEVDGTEKQILQGRNSPALLLGRLPNYPGHF